MVSQFQHFVPTVMGVDATARLGAIATEHGIHKALLVHDPFLKDAAARVVEILRESGIACVTYDGVCPDPTDVSCLKGAEIFEKEQDIDGIIGLGGGSALDTAKAINVLSRNEKPFFQYCVLGGSKPTKPGLPLILIPTTAGTGAECTYSAIVTWTEHNGQKGSIRSLNCNLAACAIIDPKMSCTMPLSVTLSSGVDALCHACEAMTVAKPNPVSDALAKEAIGLIFANLPLVASDGNNMAAREQMALAAMLAGMAFANTLVHLPHAFGHAFGAYFHKPHGNMVGLALPCLLNYAAPACPDAMKAVGRAMGLTFTGKHTPEMVGSMVGNRIYDFYHRIGFPTPEQLGIPREEVENIVDLVCSDGCFHLGPREMPRELVAEYALRVYDQRL